MLNDHFTCGDGRCNENIALSTIHQIFHHEHDRLATEFDTVTLPANPGLSGRLPRHQLPGRLCHQQPGTATDVLVW